MAKHQQRTGAFVIGIKCQQGRHGGACDDYLAQLGNVSVCHCPCHPPCQRPQCVARRATTMARQPRANVAPTTGGRA